MQGLKSTVVEPEVKMYCVMYEFKIKKGTTSDFEKAWAEFTEAIYRVRGSLGSRLHTTADPLVYIAYAQWPSKDVFEDDVPLGSYTQQELKARETMIQCTENTKRTHLDVIADFLK